jgi:hypothetical protein
MVKYKEAKNPTFFGRNRQEDFETFYSKARIVKIKELPPHPLKEKVAVGNYRLNDKISAKELETGQSFSYTFTISGEGNLSAVDQPVMKKSDAFEFYEPNVVQNIRRASNAVQGTKSFEYYAIPNEPGEYDLANYLQWIYFNTVKERYDTLRPNVVISVKGESKKNESISSNDLGSFYDGIPFEDNNLRSIKDNSLAQIFTNVFIFVALALSAVLVFKK